MLRRLTVLVSSILLLCLPVARFAEERGIKLNVNRLALVIGNGAYKTAPLENPINDAEDMAATLGKLGFKVILKKNANQRTMEESIRKFGKELRSGGVGLFYYSGHGVQYRGRNYLIPVDFEIKTEVDVKYKSVDAGYLLTHMEEAKNSLNIIILDASRPNPFSKHFLTIKEGLVKMDAPTGSILAYANIPDAVAKEDTDTNSLYTSKLLKYMITPGITVERMFKLVRRDVTIESKKHQVPWESSSLTKDFYFITPSLAKSERFKSATPSITDKSGMAVDSKTKSMEKATLRIRTRPLNAQILLPDLNSEFRQEMKLTPGDYRIQILPGEPYENLEAHVNLKPGEHKNIQFFLNLPSAKNDKTLINQLSRDEVNNNILEDIRIPNKSKLNPKKSIVYDLDKFKAGVLFYKSNLKMSDLTAHFEKSMNGAAWKQVSFFKSPNTTMLFFKKDRWVYIDLIERVFSVDLKIWVFPSDTAFSTSIPSIKKTEQLNPIDSTYSDFGDIAVPSKLKLKKKSPLAFISLNSIAGTLVYKGKMEISTADEFL